MPVILTIANVPTFMQVRPRKYRYESKHLCHPIVSSRWIIVCGPIACINTSLPKNVNTQRACSRKKSASMSHVFQNFKMLNIPHQQ